MTQERNFRKGERGFGFTVGERVYLIRCPECARENYAPAVASGECAWCGHKPVIEESDYTENKK